MQRWLLLDWHGKTLRLVSDSHSSRPHLRLRSDRRWYGRSGAFGDQWHYELHADYSESGSCFRSLGFSAASGSWISAASLRSVRVLGATGGLSIRLPRQTT